MDNTSDLSNLYRDVLLDHSKHPRNFRQPASGRVTGSNRLGINGEGCRMRSTRLTRPR